MGDWWAASRATLATCIRRVCVAGLLCCVGLAFGAAASLAGQVAASSCARLSVVKVATPGFIEPGPGGYARGDVAAPFSGCVRTSQKSAPRAVCARTHARRVDRHSGGACSRQRAGGSGGDVDGVDARFCGRDESLLAALVVAQLLVGGGGAVGAQQPRGALALEGTGREVAAEISPTSSVVGCDNARMTEQPQSRIR